MEVGREVYLKEIHLDAPKECVDGGFWGREWFDVGMSDCCYTRNVSSACTAPNNRFAGRQPNLNEDQGTTSYSMLLIYLFDQCFCSHLNSKRKHSVN